MVEKSIDNKYLNQKEDIIKAQEGDKEALERLIENNQGLLWSIVKRFGGRGFEIEDLYQIASLGFIKSIKKFDTSFEVRLSTYAVPYILGEIKRYIQEDGPIKVSRALKELNTKIDVIQKEYLKKRGRYLNIEEISKELKVSKEEITMALDSQSPVSSIYEVEVKKDEKGLSILDKLSSKVDEQNLITNKIVIYQLIQKLNEKERKLIILRYYREKTQAETAKILGTSQVQISRIEKRILEKMKNNLFQKI